MNLFSPAQSYGMNVDRVLEDLMGLETTRPDVLEKNIWEVSMKK
jgi:hypothetical protein